MPGAIFEAFDVVVLPFPFTDMAAVKRRPGLVVSKSAFNDRHDQLVLAMITSAQHSAWPSDVRIEAWRAAGLTAPCLVRLKLFTLDKVLVIRRAGALGVGDRETVATILADCLV